MVKINIVSGFLGAGKTTLIKKILSEKQEAEKLVIIENEFGEIGIDGGILRTSKAEVREINSGCICCTLMGDFSRALGEVIEKYKPDSILIEPSGVAKLSDILKVCDTPEMRAKAAVNMLIAVVDAVKYDLYISNFGEFFENQIKNSKTIILSRTQKLDDVRLSEVVASIKKINGKASIVTTPWDNIGAGIIISAAEQDNQAFAQKELKKVILKRALKNKGCKCGGSSGHVCNHSADETFDVWGIETPRKYGSEELKRMLELLDIDGQYGMILRGKGILPVADGWMQFDYTPGEIVMQEAGADYTGRLCIIGKELKKRELAGLFGV
jgi:G3E family GTPase